MNMDYDFPRVDYSRNRTLPRLPSIIIINPHANVRPDAETRPENATLSPQLNEQIDPLLEGIGKVARPLMLDSAATSNVTLSGNPPLNVLPSPQEGVTKVDPRKLYAQKPYNKTIGMILLFFQYFL